jgi:hypothetical protein
VKSVSGNEFLPLRSLRLGASPFSNLTQKPKLLAGSCDASSQKGVGDALVASCHCPNHTAWKNATRALLPPHGDEAPPRPLLATPVFQFERCQVWGVIQKRKAGASRLFQ